MAPIPACLEITDKIEQPAIEWDKKNHGNLVTKQIPVIYIPLSSTHIYSREQNAKVQRTACIKYIHECAIHSVTQKIPTTQVSQQ